MAKQLRITWVKSSIGYNKRQKETVRALGFDRLGQTVDQPDTPAVRGMINAIKHMVSVEEINS